MSDKTEELYINESGEAVFGIDATKNDSSFTNNPFLQLSNDLIANWSSSITENAAKTWKSTLKSSNTLSNATKNLPTMTMSNIDQKQKEELFLQDFLNAILPPIPTKITKQNNDDTNDDTNDDKEEEEEEEEIVYSLVSTQQTKRSELIEMRNNFEELIKQRRARKCGLDNIRYQLAFQLFDEIIRQVAIDCKERGLLLLRIRDEAKMTLQSYAILKQVASTFSINEGEKSNKGFDELIQKRNEMLEKKKKLENQLLKLENKLRDTEKEVEVKQIVKTQQLQQQKTALENESAHLRLLIDSKRRRGTGRNRRKSINQSGRNKSTRRTSIKDGSMAFNFKSINNTKSPPTSPTNV